MIDIISGILILTGALLMLLSAIGLIKLRDIYTRMSSTTKSATLGIGLLLLGTAIHFLDVGITTRSLIIIMFIFLTAPVAAHLIGRASYFSNVELWKGTVINELKGKYDLEENSLNSEKSGLDRSYDPPQDIEKK